MSRREELKGYEDQVWEALAAYLDTLTARTVVTVDGANNVVQVALAELAFENVRGQVRAMVRPEWMRKNP